MKKINLCRLTLVFSSFLFTHYSYSINVPSDLSSSKCVVTTKAEQIYCKSNSNVLPTDINTEYVTEGCSNLPLSGVLYRSLSISDVPIVPGEPIDPDWRKLVAHFL